MKLKLWYVFLPYSPLIISFIIAIKWNKNKLIGFQKLWSLTSLYFVLAANGVMLPFFPLVVFLINLYTQTDNALFLILVLVCFYMAMVLASLAIREIEYRQFLKAKQYNDSK